MSALQDLIQTSKANLFERTTLSSNTLIFIDDLTIHVNSHVENVSEFKVSHLETMNEEILKLQVCSTCCNLNKILKPGSLSKEEKFITALFSLVFLTKLSVTVKQRNLFMFSRTREVLSRINFLLNFNPMWEVLFTQFFDYQKLHYLAAEELYAEKDLMFDFFKRDSALLQTFKHFKNSLKATRLEILFTSGRTNDEIDDILYESYTQSLKGNLSQLILECVKKNEVEFNAKTVNSSSLLNVERASHVSCEIETFLKDFNDFFEKTLTSYANPEATYLMCNFERNLKGNDVFFSDWLKNARSRRQNTPFSYIFHEHEEENVIFAPQVVYKDYSHFTFFDRLPKYQDCAYRGNYELSEIPNDLNDSELDTMLVLIKDGKLSLEEISVLVKNL